MKNNKKIIIKLFGFLLLTLLLGKSTISSAQKWPAGVHDPSSIVKDGDTYYMFATGDGIYGLSSKDLITWKGNSNLSPFTKTEYPSWIKTYVPKFGGTFWAPDIIYMNGYYHLYYSCSEWGTMTSTIGCVKTKTLDPADPEFGWTDVGFLGIWSYQSGLALNAIDPALMRGADGKIWMVYGSFNEQGIVVTEIDSLTGKPYTYAGNLPGKSIANSYTGPRSYNYGEGEGAAMIYRDGYYYLFYNKGGCCAGIASSYYMVMGRSTSPRGPFVDKNGKAMRIVGSPSGGTIVMKHNDARGQEDRYYGPGHFGMYSENGIDYVTFHYYDPTGYYPNADANYQGGPTLGMAKLEWGADGWPSISKEFINEGIYTFENVNSGKVIDAFFHRPENGFPLYQYAEDTLFSQKWMLNSLGTGEFTIQNYQEPSVYIQTNGTTSTSGLVLTSDYKGEITQKFRAFTAPTGKTIIYPSTMNEIMVVTNNSVNDARLSLNPANGASGQLWYPKKFNEQLSLSEEVVVLDYNAGSNSEVIVESNGLWEATVLDDSWLSVSPAKGDKIQAITITAIENPETLRRENRIYVTSYGGQRRIIKVFQIGNTSSVEQKEKKDLEIYPNPATNQVTIKMTEVAQLEIFNQVGQKIYHQSLNTGANYIDVKSYKQGIYIFKISNKNTILKKQIVIH